ncbi:MAG: insulinase family protein [Candidatus Obscuribacterales bacterium]|nr:insulinase family protein [Candidatus Obscuribacterales bacterium]
MRKHGLTSFSLSRRTVRIALLRVLCLTLSCSISLSLPALSQDSSAADTVEPPVSGFALPAAGSLQERRTSESSSAGPVRTPPPTLPAAVGSSEPVKKSESLAAVAPGGQAQSGRNNPVQETILPNGLRVLVLEQKEFPVVSTLMWYRTGSRCEEPGGTGISHLVEHLLFQNVGSFKEGEIGAAIARSGGQFNGYTSDDFITFFETLPAGRLELALKIESERMKQARFDEQSVSREVANIQKEFENEERDPVALVSREVRALLFMQHPYHNPVSGWRSDVENLTAKHAKEFYDKHFHPNNATLVICGDTNLKAALPLVQKYFGPIAAGPVVTSRNPTETPSRSERRVSVKYPGKSEVLQVAWSAPALESGDAAALVVLEKVLNGGINGRLKQRLVDAKLCATAGASYEIKKEPGFFTITSSAIPSTLNAQQKMIEGIDSVLSQLRDKPISDGELRRAKNLATYAFHSECDGPYRAGFHLGYFDSLDKWQSSYTWPERLRAVNSADIMRVAKRYLGQDGRVVGWVQGLAAPKPAAPPSPGKTGSEGTKEHDKPFSNKMEHVRMSGYKTDDSATSPETSGKSTAQKTTASKPAAKEPLKEPDKATASCAVDVHRADRGAVRSIPKVIENIPGALGRAVTGDIPGAVGNVGSAIKNVPGAIGELSAAVANTASAIGKQIAQLAPRPEPVNGRISKRVLRNGVNLLVFESHISPVVQIAGAIEAGDVYNPADKPGMSLVAAAVLNQGGAKHSRTQAASLQDDLGVPASHMLKFDSRMESIDFQASCLSRDLATELDLVAECLSSPSLDDATLEKARQDAASVLKKSEDSMSQKVDRVLMQCLLAEKSTYCPADPSDKLKSISTISAADLQKFFAAHMVPGAATIMIAGDVQPDQAASMVERAFGSWIGKQGHQRLHAKESQKRVLRTAIPARDLKKSTLCFGQLVPLSPGHPDYGSLLIADGILINHPMVSRFEQQLAKSPALENAINNSELQVGLDPVSNLAKWSLTFSVEPSAVPSSVQTIKQELRQLARNGVTPAETAEVRRYLMGSIGVRDQSTLSRVARNELDLAQHGGTVDGYASVMASLKAATVDSVNRVIRTAFKPEQCTLVVTGSAQSIRAVRTKSADTAGSAEGRAPGNTGGHGATGVE